MIPKKIHYVWLGGGSVPAQLMACINSWKKVMPDYEIICWDERKFDIKSHQFVREAYSVKKWAFSSDYIRLYALYTEGGIYLDTDVLVKKSFDEYIEYDFFTAVEYHPHIVENEQSKLYLYNDGTQKKPNTPIPGIGLLSAVLGANKGHPFIKDAMSYYDNKHFIQDDGSFYDKIIAPGIYAIAAEKYGFRYVDELQNLRENMIILPSCIIASTPLLANSESVAIHCCAGSWQEKPFKNKFIYCIVDRLPSKVKVNLKFIHSILRKIYIYYQMVIR